MGCLLGKANRISDLDATTTGPIIENFVSSRQLLTLFDDQSTSNNIEHTCKCIFLLGNSGSGKGEFIWNLMQDHSMSNPSDYNLIYLDVETLICKNIKNRVKELLRENRYSGHSPSPSDTWTEGESTFESIEPSSPANLRFNNVDDLNNDPTNTNSNINANAIDDVNDNDVATLTRVKGYLSEFANFITGYWIQSLITDEISSRTDDSIDHNVFLINLIPNRISHFKRCLYLNQTPNFYHTPFEFYAINLINEESPMKDLDIVEGASFQNEANMMFIKYFRSINKLSHVKTAPLISITHEKLHIKLITSSSIERENVITIENKFQLYDLLTKSLVDRKQILNLNIDKFTNSTNVDGKNDDEDALVGDADHGGPDEDVMKNKSKNDNNKSRLFFVINNKIELEDVVIEVDTCNINSNLKCFVKELKQLKQLEQKSSSKLMVKQVNTTCNQSNGKSIEEK